MKNDPVWLNLMNLIITGPPSIGKTTLIKKVLSRIPCEVGGFYTQEIRRGNTRLGFKIITTQGKEQTLSHIDSTSRVRVGKYGVEIEGLEEVGVSSIFNALNSKSKVIIIDEIGKMELSSPQFKQVVTSALDAPATVIATMGKGLGLYAQNILKRQDVKLITIDYGNRDGLVSDILDMVEIS